MKEFVFNNPTAWESIRSILLFYLVLMTIPFIARIVDKKANGINKTSKVAFMNIVLIYIIVLTVIFSVFAFHWIEYSIDYIQNNKVTVIHRIDEILVKNHGNMINYNTKKLYLSSNISREALNNDVVGEICEIEYYERSGRVCSIKVKQ